MAQSEHLEGPGARSDGWAMAEIVRTVGTRLLLDVIEPTDVMLQVAPADPAVVTESLTVARNGVPLEITEVRLPEMARVHRFFAGRGRIEVSYDATVYGRSAPTAVSAADAICYLRPSRYAEADRLAATAQAEFAGIDAEQDLLSAVSSWVGTHVSYVPGSSRHTDGAVETLLQRQGVCRDYAHLVIALAARGSTCRLGSPRCTRRGSPPWTSTQSPRPRSTVAGLSSTPPCSRHDPASCASVPGTTRADTAFLSTYGGNAQLLEVEVSAFVHGELPRDDVTSLVTLT